MSKNILIVTGSNYTSQVYEAFVKVRTEGHRLYLLSDGSFRPREGIFEKHFTHDLRKTKDVLDRMAAEPEQFDAVTIKTSEWLTPLVALLAKQYGAIGNDPIVAFNCRSKYHMRQAMKAAGLPIPAFQLARNLYELLDAVKDIGLPCVAKPVGGNASYGTFMISDESDLEHLKEKYEKSIAYLQKKAIDEDVFGFTEEEMDLMGVDEKVDMVTDYLVEEFMDGPEISVDAVVQNGKAYIMGVAEQLRMEPPFFIQLAEVMPYVCSPEEQANINELTQKTVTAMNIQNSAVHIEFMKTSQGYKVVEIGCRIGGDNIHDAVFQTTGRNLMLENIRVAMGEEIQPIQATQSHTAMRYLLPTRKGSLKKINGLEELRKNPYVTEIEMGGVEGQTVAPPPESFDFLGYICARGDTPDAAEIHLKEALAQLDITITSHE